MLVMLGLLPSPTGLRAGLARLGWPENWLAELYRLSWQAGRAGKANMLDWAGWLAE